MSKLELTLSGRQCDDPFLDMKCMMYKFERETYPGVMGGNSRLFVTSPSFEWEACGRARN